MPELVFTPSQFVEVFNQTLDTAYPSIVIEGELSEFSIRKNQWVYFKLKDDGAVVDFFGSVYQLKGALEDGMMVRAVSSPRLHPVYGFKLNFTSVTPVGEGSIRRAFELLKAKLAAEGLFEQERKRPLPDLPKKIGLISSSQAAGAKDFLTVLEQRWGDITVSFADVLVQGDAAASQIVSALDYFNQHGADVEALVLVRGGGSAEDLSVFNDETLVRAIAGSRLPVLSGIGHEQDLTLADLAADRRAATPTEAAVLLVPDRQQLLVQLDQTKRRLAGLIGQMVQDLRARYAQQLNASLSRIIEQTESQLKHLGRSLAAYDPKAVLRRGYSILTADGVLVSSIKQTAVGRSLSAQVSDGVIETEVTNVKS